MVSHHKRHNFAFSLLGLVFWVLTAVRQRRPLLTYFQLGFFGLPRASSRVLKLHMASWKSFSEEFVLRSLIVSPLIEPLLKTGGWQEE